MDTSDFSVLCVLITPIYIALFGIYRKIGRYDEVCDAVKEMEQEIEDLWKSGGYKG